MTIPCSTATATALPSTAVAVNRCSEKGGKKGSMSCVSYGSRIRIMRYRLPCEVGSKVSQMGMKIMRLQNRVRYSMPTIRVRLPFTANLLPRQYCQPPPLKGGGQ